MAARLLKPKKIVVRNYLEVSHTQMLKLVRARKAKKFGFLEVAYEVDQIDNDKYNVRMEYIAKE